jgi:hypothetical protein
MLRSPAWLQERRTQVAEIELRHYIHDLPRSQHVVQEERTNISNWLLCIFLADTTKRGRTARIGGPTCLKKDELNPLSKESRFRSLNFNQSPAVQSTESGTGIL